MGKTFAGSNKNISCKQRNGELHNSANLGSWERRLNCRLKDHDKRINGKDKEVCKKQGKIERDRCCRLIKNNSYEVWCICRLVKPCERCEDTLEDTERDKTPTPGDSGDLDDSDTTNTTPKFSSDLRKESADEHVDIFDGDTKSYKTANGIIDERKQIQGAKSAVKFTRNNCALGEQEINEINETTGINLQELFSKLDELNDREEANGSEYKQGLHIADTPPGSPTSSMDSASTCSFDHFDFDTSFCSLKSTDTMEPGDLADQLSLVQQMVMEMKTGFANAMEELSKIQYGDQTLQQQLVDSKKHCSEEIVAMKQVVEELKNEVKNLSSRLQEVSDTQRSLQDKLDTYQSDKDMLLEELEQSGAINDQIRLRLSGGPVKDNNNVIPPDVAPMVHPYLNSLQNHHRGMDDYNSDSSLTAAVSRSLNLTQALGEKCLNLDISTASSDDEDNSRHSRSDSGHRRMKRHSSFQYEETNRYSQKVPPHQQVLGEVHREEAARDIADVEREYCSQLWALIEDYMNPLRDSEILGRRELHLLFPSYIPHIYEQHCIILRKMEERMKKWKNSGVVGDIFAKFTESQDGDGLLLYKDFINDFPTIINSMNKWFTHSPHFRELMQSQCLANAPVLTLLLAPLQQVPKYSILLKTLLKHTPADHPDRYYLESSLTRLKQFLNSMNDDLEHAMQAINISGQPVHRSRDTGHSARSKSSASSGEANHISRDSGVHSNEEERAKSPMSPNTTRRYLLQVLREKRDHGVQGHARHDGHPSTPRGHKAGYGSHPDLSHQPPGVQDGRVSPYMNSLPQSKMFSSLSKLPLPRENNHNRRSRSHKTPDRHRPVINRNYLRPLTPQVIPQSTSAHNFENAKRKEDYAEKMRQRPASAMEFTYGSHDQQDDFLELLAHQASLAISPPHSSSSDRSRQELQLSLQKLLAETGNTGEQYLESDREPEGHVSYHKQFLSAKERILRHDVQAEMYQDANQLEENAQEDYGIYGDDDEDDFENEAEFDHEVKPMKLLEDSHRPKIMVPKWRQNASPQPPSYNRSVTHISKQQTGSTSEENLAASLAQSLFDENKQSTLPRDKKSRINPKTSVDSTTENVQTNGSLKRKFPTNRAESPTKSPVRQSPIPSKQSLPHGKSLSFDASPNRPSNLNLSNSNSQGNAVVDQGSIVSTHAVVSQSPPRKESSTIARPNSFTKLNDVIAYTADCLEKNETMVETKDGNDLGSKDKTDTEVVNSGKLTKLDILADENMKVSSVDNSVISGHPNDKMTNKESQNKTNSKLSFATSPVEQTNTSQSPVNTESVVYYFQNRNKINQGNPSDSTSPTKSRLPTFSSMDKTSTPIKEQQQFQPISSVSPTHETFNGFSKKERGRFVRGDELDTEKTTVNRLDKNKSPTEFDEVKDESEGATKERVLRAVDKLRLSFERKKQLSEERRHTRAEAISPTNVSIQKQFNEINYAAKKGETKPVVLKTFSSPTNQVVINSPVDNEEKTVNGEPAEQKQGLYKKAGSSKTSSKFQSEPSASARQIQKLERATSPTGRSPSPTNISPYEKFKNQVEHSNIVKPVRRGTSPQRNSAEVSLIPKRSKSPTRASMERERPKSTNDLGAALAAESETANAPIKSAMKETKIPVLKKSGVTLSKSTEDVSKIKKKSHFKDQLKNIFGRKKPQISMNRPQLTTPPYQAEEIEIV